MSSTKIAGIKVVILLGVRFAIRHIIESIMGYKIIQGDCLETLKTLPEKSIQCCVTSPPYYGLRDYGDSSQIGLESSPEEYIENLVNVFREVRRVLKDDGSLWLNLGDSFRDKQLMMIPARVALALQADGWYLRSDIIWHKPNPMPESVRDRPTKSHEHIFLLSKNAKYFYDADAIREAHKEVSLERVKRPWNGNRDVGSIDASYSHMEIDRMCHPSGRNKRDVWTVTTKPYKGAHFATFPPDLIEPCILAGSAEGDTVLDPFNGSGTTGEVSIKHRRKYIGCELNPEYIELTKKRLCNTDVLLF